MKGNRTVTDVGAPILDTMGLSIIENHLLPVQTARVDPNPEQIDLSPVDVFAVSKNVELTLKLCNHVIILRAFCNLPSLFPKVAGLFRITMKSG